MKIGIVGTIWLDIPPKGYGGTEEVIYNLANGLSEKGHDVSLFAPENSQIKAHVIPTVNRPLRDAAIPWENVSYTLFHLTQAFDRADEFDILHVHLNKSQDYIALPLAMYSKVPVVFTLHFKIPSPDYKLDRFVVLNKYRHLPYVSISNSQRADSTLNFVHTAYNGLNLAKFPFNPTPSNYFVWLGKIKHDKGTKEAILAAKKANVKLHIMGAIEKGVPETLDYYEKEIKPLIDNEQITFQENVTLPEKAIILGNAKALLNPINWEEPFGLVMTESQATGTPVISFSRGAAPELIKDGQTGFLVNSVDEMVEKINQVDTLDRYACRKNVEDNFSISSMIASYEKAYDKTIKQWQDTLHTQYESNQSSHDVVKI